MSNPTILRTTRALWLTDGKYAHSINFATGHTFLASAGVTWTAPEAKMEDYGWIKIGMMACTIELPLTPEELTRCAVEQIDETIARARAEFEVKVNELLAARSKLLAIPFTPAEESAK